ncbi:GNAT family N-acetyltransferase [Halomonas sp. XH26]|uniref:GNAT family N-acetyltransferase n=1 Tax=Halomonadaceae TaxID=28256 RepID=UPI001E299590|nr:MULTISPECIES: GNAT family N-acetyltransferase [unclassified Halomonas]MCD6004159.1 GNAT family N-acetyltransferase [Halomonas sp. IOP_6]UTA80705.1 GNAT family N-acetyltransferase [Halomonas sp. XH26]
MRHADAFSFRQIAPEDAAELLLFEATERDWFEQHIEARAEHFYTPEGISQHIHEYLALNAQGRMRPLIIQHRGAIVGRANLREIENGYAKVGYRIAQHACGNGLAQKALNHLISEARCVYQINTLTATVSLDNHASQRVLKKAGFEVMEKLPEYSVVAGRKLDCVVMQKTDV